MLCTLLAGVTYTCVCAIMLPCRVQWHMCSCFGTTLTDLSTVRKFVVDYVIGFIFRVCRIQLRPPLVGLLLWKWTELTPCQSSGKQ